MIKYRVLYYGSDCTGPYDVTISLPMTVREFISELLKTYPDEWGYIGIYNKNEKIFGDPSCNYEKGKLTSTLPEEYMDRQIESVKGSGGWTRSDYILHVKENKE